MVDDMYDIFKRAVSAGRKLSMEKVEDVAQGQIYSGHQAKSLGLVDNMGGVVDALGWAANASLRRSIEMLDDGLENTPQSSSEEDKAVVREQYMDAFKDSLEKKKAKGEISEIDDELAQKLFDSMTFNITPVINVINIPHISLTSEAFGFALSSAFQSDEDAAPSMVDELVPIGGRSTRSRVSAGAMLGLAHTNKIPLWQFPAFCYWYLARASGQAVSGGISGILDTWFGKLGMTQQNVVRAVTGQRPQVFAQGNSKLDIRMEMPPLEIDF
jgi:Peptidase family S49